MTDCGCQVKRQITHGQLSYAIEYCSLHKAAPELYHAALMAREELIFGGDWKTARAKLDEAITKAKGGK